MTAYELYVLIHVSGAIVWIGAGVTMSLLGFRASVASESGRAVGFARDSEWLGLRLFLPSNLLVIASAFLVVEKGGWGYGKLWIQLGLAGFVISFLMGALFFAPGWARVGKLADKEGVDSPSVHAAMRRLLLGTRIDLGVLGAVVFVMVVKPESGDVGALLVAAAIVVGFSLLGLALYRSEGRRLADAQVPVGST